MIEQNSTITIKEHEYFLLKRDQDILTHMRENDDSYVYITILEKHRKRLEIFKPSEISKEIEFIRKQNSELKTKLYMKEIKKEEKPLPFWMWLIPLAISITAILITILS